MAKNGSRSSGRQGRIVRRWGGEGDGVHWRRFGLDCLDSWGFCDDKPRLEIACRSPARGFVLKNRCPRPPAAFAATSSEVRRIPAFSAAPQGATTRDPGYHPGRDMFAVIKTGGKQYKVAANDTIKIEKLDAAEGDIVTFDQVLMVGGEGDDLTVGAAARRGRFGCRRVPRHQEAAHGPHRQEAPPPALRPPQRPPPVAVVVRITEILLGGAKPTIAARAQEGCGCRRARRRG